MTNPATVKSPANTSTATRTSTGPSNAPTMKQALEEGQWLRSGQRGQSVQRLQEMLAARGYNVATDGRFGPETRAAVERFQRDHGCRVDGVVGPETLGAFGVGTPRDGIDSPRQSDRRQDAGTAVGRTRPSTAPPPLPAGDAPRAGQTQGPQGATTVGEPVPAGAGDARLAELQRRTMASATHELEAGVREDAGNPNRGTRIDQYARSGGMPAGQEWCGHFTAFNYTTAAGAEGLHFAGQQRMHSYQKARSFFMYSNYTDNSAGTRAANAQLRTQQTEEGSARRYLTFPGSTGDRYAEAHHLPHEVINSPSELPIRAGDTVLFSHGHVGLVEGYDPASGRLTTIEGNTNNRVQRHTYDLNDPAVRARFDGFGRPASGDFS